MDKRHSQGDGTLFSHGDYVHLFLNGLYWGLYNPSERLDSDFADHKSFGEGSDFDVIKDYSEAVDGDIAAWNMVMSMANSGLMQKETYQLIQGNLPMAILKPELEAMVDVVSLADYMILELLYRKLGLGSS